MTAFPPGRLHCRQTDGSHQEYQTMRRAERKNALPALFMRYRLRRANRLLPQTPPPSIPVEFSAMKKDPAQRRVFFWCGRQELRLWRRAPAHSPQGSCGLRPCRTLPAPLRKPFARANASTLNSCRSSCLRKNKTLHKAGSYFWCGRQELNLHGVNHKILSLARLPVPPRPHLA